MSFRHARLLSMCVSFVLMLTGVAYAQDYPQYDGVYLKLNTGDYVELPYSPLRGAHQLVFQASGKTQNQLNFNGLEGEGTYFSIEDFLSSPVVDVRQIVSIVVVGVAPRELGLHAMVDARTKNSEWINDPTGIVEHRFNGSSETVRASAVPDLLTRQQCGNHSNNMRIKRVNQFVTEYEPKVSWSYSVAMPKGDGTCKGFSRWAQVMEVILDGQAFANFRIGFGQ